MYWESPSLCGATLFHMIINEVLGQEKGVYTKRFDPGQKEIIS